MTRGIDHLVLCVADLAAARAHYQRMGFTLTPEARHPFGTANALVQLDGSFLELVGIGDPSLIPPHGETRFSFAAYARDFLTRQQGFAMLVLDSSDARADVAEFAARGLDGFDPFDFERKARLPDGNEVTVGFSLAFVAHRDMPEAMFFTCQQHAPQYFWKAEYQRHDNSAQSVGEVVLVAGLPADHEQFMQSFAGSTDVAAQTGAVRIATARGVISILDPQRFEDRFGARPPSLDNGPRLAAYQITVRSMADLSSCLAAGAVPRRQHGDLIVVDAADGYGVTIGFCGN